MSKIVEFIPNFSEGRREDVIDALVQEAQSVPWTTLLDYSSDKIHNRSTFTLAGSPEGVAEAAFRLCKLASERIDMRYHTGEHPRIGASDMFSFVPVKEITLEECVTLSKQAARRIWQELQIPSFLCEYSASRSERINLAEVYKEQFEGMPEKLRQEEWSPDYGERKIHPTAGITAVGAKPPRIAYTINLNTSDIKIADAIVKTIRWSGGGCQYCNILGVILEDRNIVQVSIIMTNYEGVPIYQIFKAIRAEANRWGVSIAESEILGLTPAKALIDCADYYLQIENFYKDRRYSDHK